MFKTSHEKREKYLLKLEDDRVTVSCSACAESPKIKYKYNMGLGWDF